MLSLHVSNNKCNLIYLYVLKILSREIFEFKSNLILRIVENSNMNSITFTKHSENQHSNEKTLLFLVTEDWYFCSHRMSLAIAAKKAGYKVFVATRVTDERYVTLINEAGITLLALKKMTRGGKNPFVELGVIVEIMKIYRALKPDIIHHVAIKGVLYGSISAKLTRMKATVNALAGLGHIFVSRQFIIKILRSFIIILFKISFRGLKVRFIFQNPDDQKLFIDFKLADIRDCYLIKGSGVDIDKFKPGKEKTGTQTIILAARMLWYKGVGELVEASRILKSKGLKFRVILVGEPDLQNPNTISKEQLQSWHDENIVEWLGFREDMVNLYSQSDIAVLPSYYGEGVPKVLIEAAAMELPIITTQMPGCSEIVRNGINGLLVKPKDIPALADAMEKLISDEHQRQKLGRAGRKIVREEFEESIVTSATLELYNTLL